MIFYTADPHFGSESIIRQAGRPFDTVSGMDESLIANWNASVGKDDTVYLLGDMSMKSGPIPAKYLSRLSGRKHLVRGNHDTGLDGQEELFDYFESVTDFLEIDDGPNHIVLCHYPIVYVQRGYMIHGHTHAQRGPVWDILKSLPRVLNAGVDINGFRPVTLEELIENNRRFYTGGGILPAQGSGHGGGWRADFRPLPAKKKAEE